jgi:hypothetical protein
MGVRGGNARPNDLGASKERGKGMANANGPVTVPWAGPATIRFLITKSMPMNLEYCSKLVYRACSCVNYKVIEKCKKRNINHSHCVRFIAIAAVGKTESLHEIN